MNTTSAHYMLTEAATVCAAASELEHAKLSPEGFRGLGLGLLQQGGLRGSRVDNVNACVDSACSAAPRRAAWSPEAVEA